MIPPPAKTRARSFEAGFVLPGVVMFVVVLTILGFSLFALSGYEAQFLTASLDESQAFYAANGGLDRARYLLASTQLLESVAANLGADVDSAGASQGGRTTGLVDWGITAQPVIVRVKASQHGHSRTVEAQFDPNNLEPYDKLFSLFGTDKGLHVEHAGVTWYSNEATDLRGFLWQNFRGVGWEDEIQSPQYKLYGDTFRSPYLSYDSSSVVPDAEVQDFLNQKLTAGVPKPTRPIPKQFDLNATSQGDPDGIGYFKTVRGDGTDDSVDPSFSLMIQGAEIPGAGTAADLDIRVSGRSVWLFDHGFYSDHTLRVHGLNGPGTDMLILCSTPRISQYGDDEAFWFEGGISSDIPVIIVSDGAVLIRSDPIETTWGSVSSTIPWLNVFAKRAVIQGPNRFDPNNYIMQLYHDTPSPPWALLSLQKLLNARALPNAVGSRRYLAYRPGTWQNLSNPN